MALDVFSVPVLWMTGCRFNLALVSRDRFTVIFGAHEQTQSIPLLRILPNQ